MDTRYPGKAICKLLGVSSGRPSQIKTEGEAAKLSEEQMAKLTAKGYSRDWIVLRKGDMKERRSLINRPSDISEQGIRMAMLFDKLKPEDQLAAFAEVKKIALNRAALDDEYLAEIVKVLTNK